MTQKLGTFEIEEMIDKIREKDQGSSPKVNSVPLDSPKA